MKKMEAAFDLKRTVEEKVIIEGKYRKAFKAIWRDRVSVL